MSNRISQVIKAMQAWNTFDPKTPKSPNGQYMHKVIIEFDGDETTKGVKFEDGDIDLEFEVPFNDDLEADEAEILIYNLTNSTIKHIKYNHGVTIKAGYGNDLGVIFKGRVSKKKTYWEGQDKVTKVFALDSDDLEEKEIAEIAFSENTSASTILKTLLGKTNLSVAVFEPRKDYVYEDSTTVSGGLLDNIRKYSEVCGVSTFINKGKIYSQYIKNGDTIGFTLSEDTGLIGSPEAGVEERETDSGTETVNFLEVEMLLQHRVTTAVQVKVNSRQYNITGRVIEGTHSYSGTDFKTKAKILY